LATYDSGALLENRSAADNKTRHGQSPSVSLALDGECGCCATGARRAALDRLKAQADQARIATALCRLTGYRRAA